MSQPMTPVLLVDDNAIVLQSAKRYLERNDFEVTAVSSGREGLQASNSGPFEAAIVDIEMPEISGIDVIRALRSRNPAMRIVATSLAPRELSLRPAIEAGADEFISKTDLSTQLLPALLS